MIRKMHVSDRNALVGILRSTTIFTSSEVALAAELIDIHLANPNQKDYTVVVVEDESFQVIGFMSFGPAPITEGVYNLYWIAVHPRARAKGHGRELVAWLMKNVQDISARMVLVETSSSAQYKPTREFYRSLGFKEVSRVRDFYRPGDDRITYIKHVTKKKMESYGSAAGPIDKQL